MKSCTGILKLFLFTLITYIKTNLKHFGRDVLRSVSPLIAWVNVQYPASVHVFLYWLVIEPLV